MNSGKSLAYSENNLGPSIDPCGTPYFTRLGSDLTPDSWTYCFRSDM